MLIRTVSFCLISFVVPLTFVTAGEWVSLFDGRSLDGWQNYNGQPVGDEWKIEDGSLTLTKGGGGNITTAHQYSDFEFSFEWKISEGGNSGIIYLSRPGDNAPYMSGPEYQILDDSKHKDGKNPKTSAGALYALIAAEGKKLKPVGEWNSGRIVKKGNHLEHWVNGKKVVETTMNDDTWNTMVSESKFANWKQFGKSAKGHIVLQDHGDQVWYRNMKVKDLSK